MNLEEHAKNDEKQFTRINVSLDEINKGVNNHLTDTAQSIATISNDLWWIKTLGGGILGLIVTLLGGYILWVITR